MTCANVAAFREFRQFSDVLASSMTIFMLTRVAMMIESPRLRHYVLM